MLLSLYSWFPSSLSVCCDCHHHRFLTSCSWHCHYHRICLLRRHHDRRCCYLHWFVMPMFDMELLTFALWHEVSNGTCKQEDRWYIASCLQCLRLYPLLKLYIDRHRNCHGSSKFRNRAADIVSWHDVTNRIRTQEHHWCIASSSSLTWSEQSDSQIDTSHH